MTNSRVLTTKGFDTNQVDEKKSRSAETANDSPRVQSKKETKTFAKTVSNVKHTQASDLSECVSETKDGPAEGLLQRSGIRIEGEKRNGSGFLVFTIQKSGASLSLSIPDSVMRSPLGKKLFAAATKAVKVERFDRSPSGGLRIHFRTSYDSYDRDRKKLSTALQSTEGKSTERDLAPYQGIQQVLHTTGRLWREKRGVFKKESVIAAGIAATWPIAAYAFWGKAGLAALGIASGASLLIVGAVTLGVVAGTTALITSLFK